MRVQATTAFKALTKLEQFCASMWTKAEVEEIRSIARETKPGILFYALPVGLQVEKGPDAVVEHLVQNVPSLLESAP